MLGAWVASRSQVGIQGACCNGGTMLIQVACAATWDHSDIQDHGPVTVSIRVDIHDHQKTTQMHGVWATTCGHENDWEHNVIYAQATA